MFSGLLDAYTKELGEFVSTVREDTSTALSSAAARLQQRLGEEAGRLDGAARGSRAAGGLPAAAPPPDLASFLAADLAHDAGFDDFRASFDLEARRELLESASAQCAEELERFVPDALTEDEFWVRYFYHQHMQRRARLLAGDLALPDDEELSWGDDEDGSTADATSEPGSDGGDLAREPSDGDDGRAEDDDSEAAEPGAGAALARSAKLVADEQAWEKQLAAISRQLERTKMRASLAEEKAARLEEELLETREEARQLIQENAELRAQLKAAPLDAPVAAQAEAQQDEDGEEAEDSEEEQSQPDARDSEGEGDADANCAAANEEELAAEHEQDEEAGDQDESAAQQEVVAQPEASAASSVNEEPVTNEESGVAVQPAARGQEEAKPTEKPQKARSGSSSDEESDKEVCSVPPASESPPLSDGWQLEGAADGEEEEGWAAWE